MALFGSKKNTKKETAPNAVEAVRVEHNSETTHNFHIIRKPRITEKATISSERGVYVFEVSPQATKNTVAQAVKELYNVTPVRVAITPIPQKYVYGRGGWGKKRGGKKAYVYLKKGETIEFV